MRSKASDRLSDRANTYLATLPERTIALRYKDAIVRLGKVSRLTDPAFQAAASAAIYLCERARTAPRSRAPQHHGRKWEAVSSAARKLNASLRAAGDVAQMRLILASSKAAFDLSIRQRHALPAFLDGLASQIPKLNAKSNYRVGALRVDKGGHKRMSPVNAHIICLAYLFDRLSKNEVNVYPGSRITTGLAWDVAADFAEVIFGGAVDPGPAKKALSDHKERLVYMGR